MNLNTISLPTKARPINTKEKFGQDFVTYADFILNALVENLRSECYD
jgi:hypothetical protein